MEKYSILDKKIIIGQNKKGKTYKYLIQVKGYTIDNCVPCYSKCNLMKSNFKKEDFLQHISKIYKFSISSTTIPKGSTFEANANGSERVPNN